MKPNCAIKPTPEEALRSNRALRPARLIAALGPILVLPGDSKLNHFEREAKLMFVFPGLIALIAIVTTLLSFLMGGPFLLNEEDAKHVVLNRNPGCALTEWTRGEGDGDHVYVGVVLKCQEGSNERRGEVLFQRQEGRWVLAWEKVQ